MSYQNNTDASNNEFSARDTRHVITSDAVSILDDDALVEIMEKITKDYELSDALRRVPSSMGKFILLAMKYGYNKNEIAWMLALHPSTVTRRSKEIEVYILEAVSDARNEDE